MSTLYVPVDIESIKKKLQQANSSGKRNMTWRPTPDAESVIRILPYRHGPDPFNILYFHWGIAGKNVLCPKTFGDKVCPVCDFADQQRAKKTEAGTAIFKAIASKMRVYIPIIARGQEDQGPKFWGVGKGVYETLLTFFVDPDYGDMTHPTEGTDILVKFVGPNAKNRFGETQIYPKRSRSPLHADKNTTINMIKNVPNIFEIYPEKTFEELEKLLDQHLNGVQDQKQKSAGDEWVISDTPVVAVPVKEEEAPDTLDDFDKMFEKKA